MRAVVVVGVPIAPLVLVGARGTWRKRALHFSAHSLSRYAKFEITATQSAGLGAVLLHPFGVGRAVVVVGVPVAMYALVHAVADAPEGLEAEAALSVDVVGEVADAAGRPTVGVVAQTGPVLVIHVSIAPPSIEHPRVSLRVKVMVHSKVVADFVGNGL